MNYTTVKTEKILEDLQNKLSRDRFNHSIGAANMAVQLAEEFNLDKEKAYIAGLLHDCAKCFEKDRLLKIIRTEIKNVDEDELLNYKTHHAPVSAYIAQKDYGVEDKEILSSIRWHTLGKLDMTDFEKIIFLADKIEPNTRDIDYRNKILSILRKENGLNKALLQCYKETIKSLVKRDLKICLATVEIYNSLLNECE